MSANSDKRRLDRLERAVSLILRILLEEQKEITAIQDQLKAGWRYPATVAVHVRAG